MKEPIRWTLLLSFVLAAHFVSHASSGGPEAAGEPGPGNAVDAPPVAKLEPERAALGPVEIDPVPLPAPAGNKSYNRLPAHYGTVVTEAQRERIYAIQRVYGPKLDEIQTQYEALKKQREEKIEQVLSADQLAQIEQLKLAAKAKRAQAKKP